ncbi:dsDNA nuclease domain-containing protein [Burkholderia sp. Bp8963]|uniref:dsDNA nuclease domain-containing protein n=1 Tax=Burkholderia sp. Bp8963 TaxID=2184547 RepID=UPI00163B5680|nr:dsDNA nuclease domain-containing protein [Burkholderia sp. Bp8963]
MSAANGATELLLVANKSELAESGGGHGSKGVDFQRWWAVFRMLELEQANEPDFLLLFEAVQDITELDSSSSPTKATVYQVKKKDSGTWSWSVLTGTTAPKAPKSSNGARAATKSSPDFSKVADSTLGKLHRSLSAFSSMPVVGYFISNAGCDFPLISGGSAATSMPCSLSELAFAHAQLLVDALSSLGAAGTPTPDLTRIKLKKIAIHPDDPSAPAIASALELLKQRSPEHAAQAAAFVESLVMKISALGRHTDTCVTFDELVHERGFSRSAFLAALGSLQTVPDRNELLNLWLNQLQAEGSDFRTITSIRVAAARVARERLTGGNDLSRDIDDFSDNWVDANPCGATLRPYLAAALSALKATFSDHRDDELTARFVMRAIAKCVDPN